MEHDPILSDLTAPYICLVIADLEANYHPFYTLFTHAPLRMVSINLTYDFRTGKGRGETDGAPLCSYSVSYFIQLAHRFHVNDCFTVAFDDGFVIGTEDHFAAEIVEFFYTEFLRRECRRSLTANRMLTLSNQHMELCRLSPSEYLEIKAIFSQLNDEIIKELRIKIACNETR